VEETGLDKYAWDELDEKAVHFLVLEGDRTIGCLRLLPKNMFSLEKEVSLPKQLKNFREVSRVGIEASYRNSKALLRLFFKVYAYCVYEGIEYIITVPLVDTWRGFGPFRKFVRFLTPRAICIKSAGGKDILVRPLYIKLDDLSKLNTQFF